MSRDSKLKMSLEKINKMAISKEFIEESKINTIKYLEYYFEANGREIKQFVKRIENEDPENWTCGFSDELVPDFEKMRKENLV